MKRMEINPVNGHYIMVNGEECTREFYDEFVEFCHITPNEFLEMNISEMTAEDDEYLYFVKLTDKSGITMNREPKEEKK